MGSNTIGVGHLTSVLYLSRRLSDSIGIGSVVKINVRVRGEVGTKNVDKSVESLQKLTKTLKLYKSVDNRYRKLIKRPSCDS